MHSHLKLLFLVLLLTQSLFSMEFFKQELITTINPAVLHSCPIVIKQETIELPSEPQDPPLAAPIVEAITVAKRPSRDRKPSVLLKDFITDKLEKESVNETDDNVIVLENYHSKKRAKIDSNKQFVCNLCPQSYDTQHYLNRHVRTAHSDDRPFSCDLCNKSFKEKHHCVEHVRRHGDARVKCPKCSNLFKRDSEVTRHLKEVHLIEK